MATAVLALWTSVALEHAALRRAALDAQTSLSVIQNLRRQAIPGQQRRLSHPLSLPRVS
ncbi:MAG: hypothetical protein M3N93_04850 [Acidobacteriota bacterium]|nr:hypothetical protein [Acidobacteriota bacterium]